MKASISFVILISLFLVGESFAQTGPPGPVIPPPPIATIDDFFVQPTNGSVLNVGDTIHCETQVDITNVSDVWIKGTVICNVYKHLGEDEFGNDIWSHVPIIEPTRAPLANKFELIDLNETESVSALITFTGTQGYYKIVGSAWATQYPQDGYNQIGEDSLTYFHVIQ